MLERFDGDRLDVLRERDYRRLMYSNAATTLGYWFTYVALYGKFAFEEQLGPVPIAGLAAVGLLPSLFVSPIAGSVVDLVDTRRTLVVSELGGAAAVSILVFSPSLTTAYACFFLFGSFNEIYKTAQRAYVTSLVDEDRLIQANALLKNVSTAARISGPGVAGALLVVLPTTAIFVVDAVSYVLSALLLATLASMQTDAPAETAVLEGFRNGVSFLRTRRRLLATIGVSGLAYGGAGVFNALVPIYVREVLGLETATFGVLTALTSGGAFVAGALLTVKGNVVDKYTGISLTTTTVGVGVLLLAAFARLTVVVPVAFVMGFSFSAVGIFAVTVVQETAGEQYTGRIIGMYRGVNKTSQLLLMSVAGVVAARTGVIDLFVGTGLLLTGVGVASLGIFRSVTDSMADDVGRPRRE